MMKKRWYLLLTALLLLGTVACGKEADSTEEATTQAMTTQEQMEVTAEEVTTQEETTEEVVITEAQTTEVSDEESITEASPTDVTIVDETTTDVTQTAGVITPEEAQELIVESFGTEDELTGNAYSFAHVNTMTVSGVEYHVFMWSWLVDGHASRLGDLFVTTDGRAIYQGVFVGDGATVHTDTNYLK